MIFLQHNQEQDYAVLSHIWLSDVDDWDDIDSDKSHRGIIEIKRVFEKH